MIKIFTIILVAYTTILFVQGAPENADDTSCNLPQATENLTPESRSAEGAENQYELNEESGRRSTSNSKPQAKTQPKFSNEQIEQQLIDAKMSTSNRGLNVIDKKELLNPSSRVCYACSSIGNPNCLKPDNRTTVMYCPEEEESCLTKTYHANGAEIVIRECGTSCTDEPIPGLSNKYSKCSACQKDLCNGAMNLQSQTVFIWIAITSVVTVIKTTLYN